MRNKREFTKKEKEHIIYLKNNEKLSTQQIADRYNVSVSLIYTRLKKWGELESRFVIYTQSEKEEIIDLYVNKNYSTYALAKIFKGSANTIWKRLKQWKVDTSKSDYHVNHNYFSKLTTDNKKYWVGFIATDGCVSDKGDIVIELHKKDTAHLRKYLNDIESSHLLKVYDNTARVEFRSIQIKNDLAKYNVVPRKSFTLKPYMFESPDEAIPYWRAVIDGDGSMTIAKRHNTPIIDLTGSYRMCEGFKDWCSNYVNSKANVNKCKSVFRFALGGRYAVPIIRVLYGDATIYLDRKKELADYISYKF